MAAPAPQPSSPSVDRAAWFSPRVMLDGARAVLPLTIGVFPFGLAYGVAVVASSIDDLAGVLASFLIIAGAAQLAMIDLIDAGAPWFVVVATALVINARFIKPRNHGGKRPWTQLVLGPAMKRRNRRLTEARLCVRAMIS